ncbi:BrnT family toxin [Granulicella rosea]|uniref:BrnT family toxin n=1 Tax=Granulicella rosea TaxID=474952 RepID=UPI001C3C4C32|nr:BrnT family toxin [Granulicella rosea]
MDFEWDEEKAASNLKKHGVSFAIGRYVFRDPLRLEVQDDSVDYGEERWLTVGLIAGDEITVVFTKRETGYD